MRKALIAVSLVILSLCSYAQEQEASSDFKGGYLGLQANELLRQVLNLGNASIPDNPYFFNYSYSDETGKSINIGFALQADEFDQQNGFNTINTEVSNFSFRIGYEKKINLGKKFFYSLGGDLLFQSSSNTTTTDDNFGGNSVINEASSGGFGIGPRFTLNYRITDRLILGTEANYYYMSLTEKFETIFENNPGNNINDESDVQRFNFAAPAVLWMVIRL